MIRSVLRQESYHDGLRPVLLALRRDSENPDAELIVQAIEVSESARLRTNSKTFQEVTRLAKGNPAVTTILKRFREAIR